MSHLSPLRQRLVTGLVATPLAFGLVACGSDDQEGVVPVAASSPSTSPDSTSPEAPPSPSPTPVDAGATDATLLDAAQTALGAVEGSTLSSIDRSGGGWEVSLVSADGTENEVDVALDGSIARGPVVDTDDDDDDTNDQAERVRLLEARVDYAAAIETARGAVPGGAVTDADLDEDNAAATWDVQFDEDTATELTVVIDATSGDVLRVEQDD